MQIPAAKIHFPDEDKREILAEIEEILTTGQLTLGKYGRQFEEEFAGYLGTKYAVAVNSGTSALEIILRALDIEGHSVIVPTNTFFATPASVIHAGGKVIFADMADNLCLDPDSVKQSIREDTKAVILVHIGGLVPPQVREIKDICQRKGLFLIEDAAHAHGSAVDGQKAGTFGIAAAFSFYPTKVILDNLGGFCGSHVSGFKNIRGDFSIEFSHYLGAFFIYPGDYFSYPIYSVVIVAGVYPLWRVSEHKILDTSEFGLLLKDWSY